MTDTVQQLAADLTREAQETGLNWVQELADRATALAGISMEHQSAPPPERAILTDLIAELRAEHYPHPCTDPEDFPCCCESCAGAWPCLMADMADRAEERLREVTGDE